MRTKLLPWLMLILLSGCGGGIQQKQVLSTPKLPQLTKDEQVQVALFKYLLDQYQRMYPKPDPSWSKAVYLMVGGNDEYIDPNETVMAAVGQRSIPIKKVSQCFNSYGKGSVIDIRFADKNTCKKAYILWIGQIQWFGPYTAEIDAGRKLGLGANVMKYRVYHQDKEGWKIIPSYSIGYVDFIGSWKVEGPN